MKRMVGILCVAAASAWAAGPQPEWRLDAYPYRMFLSLPSEAPSNVIVRLPRAAGMPVTPNAFTFLGPGRTSMPFRVAYSRPDEVILLAATGGAGGSYCLYFGAAGPPTAEVPVEPDPLPIMGVTRPAEGVAVPSTVEGLRHMTRSLNLQTSRRRIASFDQVQDLTPGDGKSKERRQGGGGRRRQHGVSMSVLRTYLVCRDTGVYRFALSCADAGYVTLDGEEAASWMGEHATGEWRPGRPLTLKAGLHRLDVSLVFAVEDPSLRVGWVCPGHSDIVPLAGQDLLGAYEATETRIERANRTLQPGFTPLPGRAYRFRDTRPVFVPVTFRNTTQDWITGEFSARWNFGDGGRGTGPEITHVYGSQDGFKATLEVRDSLGFAAACSHEVDCRGPEPDPYAVSFELLGVPPVCYAAERIEPYVLIASSPLPSLAFEIGWEFSLRSGKTLRRSETVKIGKEPARVPAGGVGVGDVAELRWTAQHEGGIVGRGVMRFLRPPLQAGPDRVVGGALVAADGNQIVLVPDDGASARPGRPGRVRGTLGTVVCVDDTLAVGGLRDKDAGETYPAILGRLLRGAATGVRYEALPAWETFPESSGFLRKFVDVPRAVGAHAAVAVLSVGLRDLLNGQGAAAFECQAAALTDLLTASKGVRVVWVTPPPYPSELDRAREFAAAIRRVAEPRGLDVADLFTRFRCEERNWRAFFSANPLALSERGHRLAAQEIARAVVGE